MFCTFSHQIMPRAQRTRQLVSFVNVASRVNFAPGECVPLTLDVLLPHLIQPPVSSEFMAAEFLFCLVFCKSKMHLYL